MMNEYKSLVYNLTKTFFKNDFLCRCIITGLSSILLVKVLLQKLVTI